MVIPEMCLACFTLVKFISIKYQDETVFITGIFRITIKKSYAHTSDWFTIELKFTYCINVTQYIVKKT